MEIIVTLVLLAFGYIFGQYHEKKHFKALRKRERRLIKLPVEVGTFKENCDDMKGVLVSGHVVIGSDYFKNFVTNLKGLLGGQMGHYERLVDRGRREAILRMKEEAKKIKATRVVNLRIETSRVGNIHNQRNPLPCVEVFAYGTALIEKRSFERT